MVDKIKRPKRVGEFIRKQRELLGISQRALGLLFDPRVTTQFISNLERGVTPLPPIHIPILAKALKVEESELMALLEQEYAERLKGRLGKADLATDLAQNSNLEKQPTLSISPVDYDFMKIVYTAYSHANADIRKNFAEACQNILLTSNSEKKI